VKAWVGTSGFSYKEWKGPFYPEDLPDRGMLAWYAGRLNSVEINNTFYRMPTPKVLAGWAEQVPEDFAFVLKASRRITHQKKLADAGEELDYLVRTSAELGTRLGPMLFQLPPWLKKDVDLLRAFLTLFPEGFRGAFEFRSSSWFTEDVYDALEEGGAALVVGDTSEEKLPPVVRRTAPFGYARLRREEYTGKELGEWAARFGDAGWEDLFVFFKHEDAGAGPKLAEAFRKRIGA
jgi:uncharacterized protein YecE (DUF72 family)